jgi:hypothetical protein
MSISHLITNLVDPPGQSHYGSIFSTNCSNYPQIIVLSRWSDFSYQSSNSLFCKPIYTKYQISATVNASSSAFVDTPAILSSQNTSVAEGDHLLTWMDKELPGSISGASGYSTTISYWFGLVAQSTESTFDDLMDADKLSNASADAFRRLFGYVAGYAYLQPATDQFEGTSKLVGPRLVAQALAIRALEGVFAAFIVIVLTLYVVRPQPELDRDPGPISAVALALKNSPELAELMSNTGQLWQHETEKHLEGHDVSLELDNSQGLAIVLKTSAIEHEVGACLLPSLRLLTAAQVDEPEEYSGFRNAEHSWTSTSLRSSSKAVLIGSLIAAIIALEVLCQWSLRHYGISNVQKKAILRHIPSYLLAALLFFLGLAVASFDFSVRTMELFSRLAERSQRASTLAFNPLLHPPVTMLWHVIRQKRIMPLLTACMVILIAASKIVVAGVFVTQNMDVRKNATFTLLTTFATNTIDSSLNFQLSDEELYTLSSFFDLSFTPWVTPQAAVGSVDVAAVLSQTPNVTALEANLPVLYADVIDCVTLPTSVQVSANVTAETVITKRAPVRGDDPGCTTNGISLIMPPASGYFGFTHTICSEAVSFTFGEAKDLASAAATPPKAATIMCHKNLTLYVH